MQHLRATAYHQLAPAAWPHDGLSPVNQTILWLVIASIAVAVIETEPLALAEYGTLLIGLDLLFTIIFTAEIFVRAWAYGENPNYQGVAGKIRFFTRWPMILDEVVVIAMWLPFVTDLSSSFFVILRVVRVLRIVSLARHSRWAAALRLLAHALVERKRELTLSLGLAGVTVLVAATILYVVEGAAQPDAFGSIPRAMWWAVATLTTVGYGDVYPLTAVGKFAAGLASIAAICVVAMPAGIMAAAFNDVFEGLRGKRGERE